MPWWSWILIWIALVAVSLLFYALLGIRLYRQAMAVLKDLGAASAKLGHLVPAAAGNPQGPADGASDAAVFASPARMRHDYDASKASRTEARRQRRVQRKRDRGQPQTLRDLDLR